MSPQLLGLLAAIYASNARVLGMQAANNARAEYEAPAYTEDDFGIESQHLERLSVEARNAQ